MRGIVAIAGLWTLTTAIYGGETVTESEGVAAVRFSWRVGNASGSCSGSLIAPRSVLTAAHCVRTPRDRPRQIRRARIGNPNGTTQNVRVAEVVVHPDYAPAHPERGNDLAILKLADDARATPMPLVADDSNISQGAPLRVWGFGITRARSNRATRLREARLELLSPFHCFSGDVQGMARTRMCGANPSSGVCPGDSGAPVLVEVGGTWRQLGVVSLAIDNAQRCTESATVLTRLSAFSEWIASVTR